jgi:peroxiredoxin
MSQRPIAWFVALALLAPIALGGTACAQQPSSPHAIALGTPLPKGDFALRSVDGKDVTIRGLAGKKGVLVVFTCNTCPYARGWEERIVALGNALSAKGVGMIAINANDPERVPGDALTAMQERAKMRGMKYPYAADPTGEVAGAFGASHTPEAFLFDAKGVLVYHGAVDDNMDDAKAVKTTYLANAVADLCAGKAQRMAETKAIGCSIKYRAKPAS